MGHWSRLFVLGTPALALASASVASAQTSLWGRIAEEDLAAARALLVNNHPGAAPEVGDRLFQQQLASGYQAALEVARKATTFGEYRGALVRFAASFDDQHIQSDAVVQADRQWPGFRVAYRGGRWIVTHRASDSAPEPGSALLSCDGHNPDELATVRLSRFYPSWGARAQRIRASSTLLLDEGYGVPKPTECSFAAPGGQTRAHKLNWNRVSNAQLDRLMAATGGPEPEDIALTQFQGGWWIRLGNSGGRAVPLLAKAREQRAALRSAPFVIMDLRGNDGGASYFSDELAKLIYGEAAVARARSVGGSGQPETIVWRASPAALNTLDAYVERVGRMESPEHPGARGMVAQREAVRRALESGEALARAPAVIGSAPVAPSGTAARRVPRVILITDRFCFSSCLMGTHLFRQLGATHVGEETHTNSRYSDVRRVDLPSGLSTFSTMQSYSTSSPMRFGPYTPTIAFNGNLGDDAAVQDWVAKALLGTAKGDRAGRFD